MEPAAATKSPAELSRQYKEATELVGEEKINHMEQMMRDKLQQRTKTGPFQLRKTFKYFDRDGSGGIDFDEFQRAMELMGFQFNEMQQLALFARYDESCTGDVDYTEFVNKLMESDFKGVASSAHGGRLFNMVQKTFSMKDLDEGKRAEEHDSDVDSDLDEEERDKFRKQEVKKIFMMLDDDNSGDLDKREVNLMMLALGRQITRAELDRGWETIDSNNSGTIDFEEFYEWYVSVAR
jgi:Ca2+-binding EF-hand superfamily protein